MSAAHESPARHRATPQQPNIETSKHRNIPVMVHGHLATFRSCFAHLKPRNKIVTDGTPSYLRRLIKAARLGGTPKLYSTTQSLNIGHLSSVLTPREMMPVSHSLCPWRQDPHHLINERSGRTIYCIPVEGVTQLPISFRRGSPHD